MKKNSIWCLIAILIFNMIFNVALAAASGIDTISVTGNNQGNNGQDVFVYINATNALSVENLNFDLSYDNNVITSNSVMSGNLVNTLTQTVSSGKISIGFTKQSITGTGSLVKLGFHVVGHNKDKSNLDITINPPVTDTNGNEIPISSIKIVNGTFTVVDTTPPAITLSKPTVTENANASGPKTKVDLGTATVSDPDDSGINAINDAPADGFPIGKTTVTWTATDNAGNKGTATQTVTITDNTLPIISGNQNITKEATGNRATIDLSGVTCSDNSGSCSLSNNAPTNGFPIGTTTITWTAKDPSGNSVSATQLVTITDTTLPTIVGIQSITKEATGDIPFSGENRTVVDLGSVTCNDNSGSCSLTNNTPTNGFPIGTTTVTWTAKDPAGNIASANQSVTITDTTGPNLFQPNDIVAEATGTLTKINIGNATAFDLVDPNPVIVNDAPINGFPLGNTSVIWQAKDKFGNPSSKKMQIITIRDTTPPNLTAPPDIFTMATGNKTKVDIGNATALDLIDPSPKITNNAPSDLLFPIGITVVTWVATDSFNNAANKTQNITVKGESGINLSVDKESRTVFPNMSATYNITVNNTGLVGDAFSLVFNNKNGAENVNVFSNENVNIISKNKNDTETNLTIKNPINLSPSENQTMELIVSDSRPGTYPIYVTAISITNQSKNATITTLTEVIPVPTPTPTPTPTPRTSSGGGSSGSSGGSSSSGGGGGGGGVSSLEPFFNIFKSETREKDLVANAMTIYSFVTPELVIYEAGVIDLYSENEVALRIELLKNQSNKTEKLTQGIPYKYINAWIGSTKIKSIDLKYKVNNSWMNDNKISAENVKLFKYFTKEKKWKGLLTTVIKSDTNYTYFDSETESLSSFVILGLNTGPAPTVQAPIVTVPPTPVPTPSSYATYIEERQPVANIEELKKPQSNNNGLILGLIIISVLVVSFVFWKKNINPILLLKDKVGEPIKNKIKKGKIEIIKTK